MTDKPPILLVEDEPLIAMMLEDFLDMLGYPSCGCVDTVADALDLIGKGGIAGAIVDVHLRGGEKSWPIADALSDRGIPFLLATGGHVDPPPGRHADAPTLSKPFTMDSVAVALEKLVA
jgi:DNA-binding response OmpR family regulator